LKSGFELERGAGDGQWLSNGFQALNNNYSFYSSGFPDDFPTGNDPRTVEVIFRIPEEMFDLSIQHTIFMYGASDVSTLFAINYRGLKRVDCGNENQWIFQAINGNLNNLVTCLSSTPSLTTANTINTVTSTYANSIQDVDSTNSYINNSPATVVQRVGASLNTSKSGMFFIGRNLSGSTFLSLRLYNRVLESDEIAKNAALDQIRYLDPPKVTIDDNECTEVVVLSPNFLMCTVPPGTEGLKNIKVESKGATATYDGAYRYVHSTNDFYVSNLSSIVGIADTPGQTLTLTGNKLGEITKVEVGGVECTIDSANLTTCTFTLPSLPAGEVDIVLTVNGSTIYRFAKIFEYQ
jgi:hypothetical protein